MLEELNRRANVITRRYKDKLVFIYDDHRWLLNILFKLYKEEQRVNDIVSFDAHDDAVDCPHCSEMLKQIGVDGLIDATEKQFGAFVDYDIRSDDGNWLRVACELGLIRHSCTIGNRYNSNIINLHNEYKSENGDLHFLFEMSGDLWYEIGNRGKLGDSCRAKECDKLRKFFDSGELYYHCIGEMSPFILDFDLDYFTMETSKSGVMAWTPRVWEREYVDCAENKRFTQCLMSKASIITICREPDFCGSIGDSNKILEMLDMYLFEGNLGAKPPF